MRSEIQKTFFEDIREKKKAASGIHSRTGKRGYVGKMRFPTDIMSRKDKYNYRKAGKVMVTNMYDEILKREDFDELEKHEQRNRLQYWRTKYTNKEIMAAMGCYNKQFYDYVEFLELPKAERKKTNRTATATKAVSIESSPEEVKPVNSPALKAVTDPQPVQEIITKGMYLVYNGKYTAEHIQKQLQKFITILEGEEEEFYIELKLMEKV